MKKQIPLQIALILAIGTLTPQLAQAQGQDNGGAAPVPAGDGQNAAQPAPGEQGGAGGHKWHRRRDAGQAGQNASGQGDGGEDRRAARRAKMMKRFDKNGDGKLDDSEKSAMKDFMQQMRARRQARGGGGAAPGGAAPAGGAPQGGAPGQ